MSASLDEKDLKELGRRLRTLHARMVSDLEELEVDALGSPSRPLERQGDATEVDAGQEIGLGVLEQEEQSFTEVVEALARLDEGTFGRCEECEEWIPRARLIVVPWARRCVSCEDHYGPKPPPEA